MLWNAVRDRIETRGGQVRMNSGVNQIHREGTRVTRISIGTNGTTESIAADRFISSMPLTELIRKLDPPAPPHVLESASKLRYRDFLTVCLIVNNPSLFPDNWIYIHDPAVKVGRIQNFKNWSPEMVPDQTRSSLGLEYFCTEGDETWSMSDADLVELAKRELARIGLAKYEDIEDGCVFRVPKSYPMYDSEYTQHLAVVRAFIDTLENCHTVGRNGLHRYNNQDHSMLTGMYAARNLLLGERNDLWSVNADMEYHEEVRGEKQAGRNGRRWITPDERLEAAELAVVFSRVDGVALGAAVGIVSGLILLLATLFLVIKGGQVVGPNLALLSQYFPGYTVTVPGALLGAVYGLIAGGAVGWLLAATRNVVMFLYWVLVRRRAEHAALKYLLAVI
jgi:hypothetical protein